ncbi:MAG: polysaccharide deacetylase family protein [Clostridia bacterium]|nr:polysaccharide deacetylase family protein [Clostridia bacterium]
MEVQMMKLSHLILTGTALVLVLAAFGSSVYANDETKAHSWYCRKNDTHTIPELDPSFEFIYKYDGAYADKNAGEDDKVIYLTFDAGYENGNIAKILDTMKAHNAKGAFFILENLVKRDTELVKRMAEEGHLVCNHTASHPDMTAYTDKSRFAGQLEKLEKTYTELTGYEMARYYRPPEGRFSEQNLQFAKELGYKTVFWSFAYADWDNDRQPDTEKAFRKIMDHTHNGEVILLHPTSAANAAILDRLLSEWESQGYRFGSLNELFEKKT